MQGRYFTEDCGIPTGISSRLGTVLGYNNRRCWRIASYDVSGDLTLPPTGLSTLSSQLGDNIAIVLRDRNLNPSNHVVVGAAFNRLLLNDPAEASLAFVHEALHVALGLDDPALAESLGFGSNLDVDAASWAIQEWLRHDCPPPSK